MPAKIIVALDVDTLDEAVRLVDATKAGADAYKVGSQLYARRGPEVVKQLQDHGATLFLDLKLHDIPNTVEKAAMAIAQMGVAMFTIHVSGGWDMMRAAVRGAHIGAEDAGLEDPITLGVTLLTSLDEKTLHDDLGCTRPLVEQVQHMAQMAAEAGCAGVVASAQELKPVREAVGDDVLIVTPGVRPEWAQKHDQKRTMTPREAGNAGADYLVIGRPITGHDDPAEALRLIREELA
jgi:orotidine-5'-phosphate decarboxylase